ncbi:MAG: hypothetical protein KGI25_09740 [Thaumarchaeota archaeon]|nr:hypothetical protein [Nitrososphaerota archaeon]
MKLHEITNPKEEDKKEEQLPLFLRPQAGPKLTQKDRREIARRIRLGQTPAMLRKQAESVE